jgi:hypothetical protein
METDENGYAEFIIWHEGDSSVGIAGDETEVRVWVGDDPSYQEFVRETLCEAFNAIWDFRVHCATDDELEGAPDDEEEEEDD